MNKKTLLITFFSILFAITYIGLDKYFLINKLEKKEINDYKNYVNEMYNHDFSKYTYNFENGENKNYIIKKLSKIENKYYIQYKHKKKLNEFNDIYNTFLKHNKDYLNNYNNLIPYNKTMLTTINQNLNFLDNKFQENLKK